MTLTDYRNQKRPVRLPDFSVHVKPEECTEILENRNGIHISLKHGQTIYDYVTFKGHGGAMYYYDLRTGELRNTVFKLIE